jgi:NhaA family Na+:H+ antiporter
MAVFFFGVGLEIKREFLVGELADRHKAMLPIAAAVGGMVAPALIYAGFNVGGCGAHGWGIPMATDIAFALGALAVLGSRIPEGLKVFLVALAIVDDLGALLVIAIFYAESVRSGGVAVAAACWGALFLANRAGIRRGPIDLLPGLALRGSLFYSGLHATLAGVLTAFFVPTRTRIVPAALARVTHRSAAALDAQAADGAGAMNAERFGAISVLGRTLEAATSPLQRFEHMVQPLFALFNAGVAIESCSRLGRSRPTRPDAAGACPPHAQTRRPAQVRRVRQDLTAPDCGTARDVRCRTDLIEKPAQPDFR